MAKFFYLVLICLLFLPANSFARTDKLQALLQSEYGYELRQVPYFIKFSYKNKFNRDWSKTDYVQRKAFLVDYETNLAAQKAKEKAEAKAEALKEKQYWRDKKAKERDERNKLRAQEQEERNEERADRERQKELDQSEAQQQRDIEEMRKQSFSHG